MKRAKSKEKTVLCFLLMILILPLTSLIPSSPQANAQISSGILQQQLLQQTQQQLQQLQSQLPVQQPIPEQVIMEQQQMQQNQTNLPLQQQPMLQNPQQEQQAQPTSQPEIATFTADEKGNLPNRYIVVLKDNAVETPRQLAEHAKSLGAKVSHVYEYALKGFAMTVPNQKVLDTLANNPAVDYVEADSIIKADLPKPGKPEGMQTQDAQKEPSSIQLPLEEFVPEVKQKSKSGKPQQSTEQQQPPSIQSHGGQHTPTGINRVDTDLNNVIRAGDGIGWVDIDIAIVDTGIRSDHADLNVYREVSFLPTETPADFDGHGTHVAGTAAACDNTIGVVGIAPCAWLSNFKVLGSHSGTTAESIMLQVLDWLTYYAGTDDPIEVANMSLYWPESSALNTAMRNTVAAGVTIIVAAGNFNKDASTLWPAKHPDVITVSGIADNDGKCGRSGGSYIDSSGSTESDDTLITWSNYGSLVEIAAPGSNIYSTYNDGTYTTMSGTSMASPHVAGAAGLIKALRPWYTPANIAWILDFTGVKSSVGTSCDGNGKGYFFNDRDTSREPLLYMRDFGSILYINTITPKQASKSFTISGFLKDGLTGYAISGKTITFSGTTGTTSIPASVTTTSDGTFRTSATTSSTEGKYWIRAQYSGDSVNPSTTGQRSFIIDKTVPEVRITSPANGATFSAPATVTIRADAKDKLLSTDTTYTGKISKVEFLYKRSTATDYTLIKTDTVAPYDAQKSSLSSGSYNFIVRAYDEAGNRKTSSTITVSVR